MVLTAICSPPVLPEQEVLLLLGDRQIPCPLRSAATETLVFPDVTLSLHPPPVSLRVDGVDSLPVEAISASPNPHNGRPIALSPEVQLR